MRHDVVIAGAGPAGLMLACQLARRGIRVGVYEQGPGPNPVPRAIGISVPSLEIFRGLGLDGELIRRGLRVQRAVLHGPGRELGTLNFSRLAGEFKFVLSVPQHVAVDLLAQDLAGRPGVALAYRHRVTGRIEGSDHVTVHGQRTDGARFEAQGRFVVACDGAGSLLRKQSAIAFPGGFYPDTFLMGDFVETNPWRDETHVWFTPRGSVETFPMPGGIRRYVVSTPALVSRDEEHVLRRLVQERTGLDLSAATMHWKMAFKTWHHLASRYWDGRLVLAGDAAHLMSPIVGQNMNTAFADAELLALVIEKALRGAGRPALWFDFYQELRRKAARAAMGRAALVMRLGTSGGPIWSALRNAGLRAVLNSPVSALLPPLFAMTSIPHRNLQSLGAAVPDRL